MLLALQRREFWTVFPRLGFVVRCKVKHFCSDLEAYNFVTATIGGIVQLNKYWR